MVTHDIGYFIRWGVGLVAVGVAVILLTGKVLSSASVLTIGVFHLFMAWKLDRLRRSIH